MKSLLYISVFIFTLTRVALANQIEWGAAGPIGDHNANALSAAGAADGVTALVQLIYCGINGEIDIADQSDDGATGDDIVVAYSWIGFGFPLDGWFSNVTPNEASNPYADGSQYYIRAWETPSSSSGTGYVPTGSTYYGNSTKHTISFATAGLTETISAPSFNTTIAIPEPAAATLIALASGAMLACKRFFGRA